MNKDRKKYLFKNTMIFAIGNFSTKMIAFFLVPLYTNILTTAEYGTVDLITTLSTFISHIIVLNIGEAVMRFCLDKNADVDKVLSVGLSVLSLAAIIGIACIPISSHFEEIAPYSIYFYFNIVSLGFSTTLLCYLRGRERLVAFSVGNIIHSLAIALLNILFLSVFSMGVKGYFTAYIISNFLTALFAFFAGDCIKGIKRYKLDVPLTKQMLKFSVALIPNTFMWWIMNSLDRVMVMSYLGVEANGIYAISYKIPTLLSVVATVFTQAWTYSAIKEKDSVDNVQYTNSVYNSMFALLVTASVGMMMVMKPFLSIYVEDAFYVAWRYTPPLIVGCTFLTLSTFVLTSYTVHKDSKGILFSAICGATVKVVLALVLINTLGLMGSAISTSLSYVAVYVYRVIDTRKYLKLNVLKKTHVLALGVMIVAGLTMFLDTALGQALLVAEFIVVVIIFREELFGLAIPVLKKLKRTK